MFAALMIIVTVLGPVTVTDTVRDTRGPYATMDECQARLTEMVSDHAAFIARNPRSRAKIFRAWCQRDTKGQDV